MIDFSIMALLREGEKIACLFMLVLSRDRYLRVQYIVPQ